MRPGSFHPSRTVHRVVRCLNQGRGIIRALPSAERERDAPARLKATLGKQALNPLLTAP